MSHELRTPMTGVLGMLDLALQGELADEQRGYLEAVGKSAHALLRILNDILDFSRIESGMIAFVEEPFLLHEAVRGAMELFDIEARCKGLELVLDISPDTPQVMAGDEGRVRQILLNLVGNAVKFTEQGKVVIRVAAGEAAGGRRQVTFTVADTGIGIPEEKRQTLFRSFSQADDSHTRPFGGTGLGLAISKEVAERMGGTISFTSEAKAGSSFVVTLPLREAVGEPTAAATSLAPDRPSAAAEGTKPRLLVAEDDPTIQNVIGLLLRSGGFDVDFAANGEEAVAMWAKGGYDLVLMDVQMPLMDGFEAVRAIREREKTGTLHTPIVAVTGHAYLSDQQKCLDAGMDAYVAKPIDFQRLLEVVRKLLGGKVKEKGTVAETLLGKVAE
jgi:CheY-like chemotaxis protein